MARADWKKISEKMPPIGEELLFTDCESVAIDIIRMDYKGPYLVNALMPLYESMYWDYLPGMPDERKK